MGTPLLLGSDPFAAVVDVTWRLDETTPVYPGDAHARIHRLASISAGATLTSSALETGCHVGTHVDAPAHFVEGGACIEDLDLWRLVGPAHVLDLTPARGSVVEPSVFAAVGVAAEALARVHVLFKTRLALDPERPEGDTFLSVETARYLAEHGVASVGIDAYSLDAPDAAAFPAHGVLARAGIPVFVCLDLTRVPAGACLFIGLPLKLGSGAEGAPVRALVAGL